MSIIMNSFIVRRLVYISPLKNYSAVFRVNFYSSVRGNTILSSRVLAASKKFLPSAQTNCLNSLNHVNLQPHHQFSTSVDYKKQNDTKFKLNENWTDKPNEAKHKLKINEDNNNCKTNVNSKPNDDNEIRVDEKTTSTVEENLSMTARFKKMYKDYWYVLLPVHIITSTFWLGGFYYLSTSGVDIPALLESLHFSESVISKLRDSSMGHVAITYMCYKIATPLRYTVTLGGTTLAIKYLSMWGYIKPVPSKEKLKQIYNQFNKK